MKLCIITHTYPHVGEPWIYEPVSWLRERGHAVGVIAAEAGELPDTPGMGFGARITHGWLSRREKVRSVTASPLRAARALLRAAPLRHSSPLPYREVVARAALPEITSAEIILAHFGDVAVEWLPVAAVARRRLAAFFHGYDATALPRLKPAFYTHLFSSGAGLLTNSLYMKSRLMVAGAREDRIALVRYGVPHEVTGAPAPELSAKRILTIARLMPKKGLDDSIAAFARAQGELRGQWRYEIVGRGELRDQLVELSASLRIRPLVDFRGVLSRPNTLDALRRSSIFVLASKVAPNGDTEGTPVALIEAAVSGVPIVATRHAGIPDLLPPDAADRGFLVPEGDVEALARAIGRLSANEPLRREWGSACRSHASACFSAAAHIEGLLDALRTHARVPELTLHS